MLQASEGVRTTHTHFISLEFKNNTNLELIRWKDCVNVGGSDIPLLPIFTHS